MPTVLSAAEPLVFHPDADDLYAANFTAFGIGSRTIASVGTIASDPSGLTFADKAANSATIYGQKGQTVGIGKAVQFRIDGAVVDTDYVIEIPVTYSDGRSDVGVIQAWCRDR